MNKLLIALVLLAAPAMAAEPNYFFSKPAEAPAATIQKRKDGSFELTKPDGTVVKFGKQIVVHDNLPVEKVPAAVKDMTPEQFEAFAKQQNNNAYAWAKIKHEEYLAVHLLTTMNLASSDASHVTRFGGGYGAGGFGGNGGYLGYNTVGGVGGTVNYPYGYYSGTNTGTGGSGGFGSGFSFNGNTIRTNDSASSQSWVKTFPDLNDGGGGPVTLINPYCFDYWRQHTE